MKVSLILPLWIADGKSVLSWNYYYLV